MGRLDKDTSGLLLLTNDTDFADFIMSSGIRNPQDLSGEDQRPAQRRSDRAAQCRRGDEARRSWPQPLSVRRREDRGKYTWLDVVLTEGKNREVRRMVEAVGFKVLKLVRTRIGPLTMEGLQVGKWRELTSAEVSVLRRAGKRPAPAPKAIG